MREQFFQPTLYQPEVYFTYCLPYTFCPPLPKLHHSTGLQFSNPRALLEAKTLCPRFFFSARYQDAHVNLAAPLLHRTIPNDRQESEVFSSPSVSC